MPAWVSCGGGFIEADVIRWREPVWKPKARKTAKPVKIGERVLTGQVVKATGEWVTVLLKRCETRNAETWWREIPALKTGAEIRRKRATIARGRAERLPWSDESARAAVAGKVAGRRKRGATAPVGKR